MRTLTIFSLSLLLSLVSTSAFAVDGVLEINQTCAVNTGCFPGDGAGFPVTITASGSYRFTSDLTNASAALRGIEVLVDNVTIDMNGFSLIGPVTCTGAGSALVCTGTGSGYGIFAAGNHVSVLNGTIRGSGFDGMLLGSNCRVDGVTAQWNGRDGLAGNSFCVVRNSSSSSNNDRAFSFTGVGNVIENCTGASNKINGFILGVAAVVRGSSSYNNGGQGFQCGAATRVEGSTAYQNKGDGIFLGTSSTASGNSAYNNGDSTDDDQIQCTTSCQLSGNSASTFTGQGYGLNLGAGTTASGYSHNTVRSSGGLGTVNGGDNQGGNTCNGNSTCP